MMNHFIELEMKGTIYRDDNWLVFITSKRHKYIKRNAELITLIENCSSIKCVKKLCLIFVIGQLLIEYFLPSEKIRLRWETRNLVLFWFYDRYGTGLEMLKMKRKRGQVGVWHFNRAVVGVLCLAFIRISNYVFSNYLMFSFIGLYEYVYCDWIH